MRFSKLSVVACFLSLLLTPVAAQAFSTPVKIMVQNQSNQPLHVEIHGAQRIVPPYASWTGEYSLPAYLFKNEQYTLQVHISDNQGRGNNVVVMISNIFTVMPTLEHCQCVPPGGEFGDMVYETRADREGESCYARVTVRSR